MCEHVFGGGKPRRSRGGWGHQYITEYDYRDPLYEGRQREFRGFERARARRIGDQNSPTDISESTFLLGECADETDNDIEDCAPSERWRENPREALKGLPLISEKYDEHGVYLSSTFNAYKLRTLYVGLDGRLVRHAFLSQTDAVAYDTAPFTAGNASIDIGALEVEHTPSETEHSVFTTAPLRSPAYAQIRSTNTVDAFGNQTLAVAHGCISGPECPSPGNGIAEREVIQSHTIPTTIGGDNSGWLWRTGETWVDSTTRATQRNHTTTDYDFRGRPTHQHITVYDIAELDRFRDGGGAVAPLPANLQAEAQTYTLSQTTYDNFGNATRTEVPTPFNRCADVSYGDDPYAQLALSETLWTSPGCTGNNLTTAATYDYGLGVVTLALDFAGQPTEAKYDPFGRVTELYQPNPAGGQSSIPSVKIAYYLPPDLGIGARHSIIHTQTQDASDPSAAEYLESFAYVDGFGRNIMALAEADPTSPEQGGDGAQWIVGNLLEYDNKSAVRRKYLEFYWNGDPLAYPFENTPATQYGRQRYDAFGRQIQTFDLDGTVTLQSRYHALSTDLWDAADLENGVHHNSYASERKDGHGRTIETTERFRENGSLEQRHVRTQYLPTGEPEIITRVRGSDTVTRWMQYDSHGRMVVNVEPNTTDNYLAPGADLRAVHATTKPWRYAYNALGELLGTSDARGCGQSFHYDSVGRLIAEDYSPCETHHAAYSSVSGLGDPDTVSGAEVYYLYDSEAGGPVPAGCSSGFTNGRTVAVFDKASVTKSVYDARGRVTASCLRVAEPDSTDEPDLDQRYAARTYRKDMSYDAADREIAATTGLVDENFVEEEEELLGSDGLSQIVTSYSARGTVKAVGGSYGSLIENIQRTADGLLQQMKYGDAAKTTTAYSYDQRRRLSSVQTYRGPPATWDNSYDRVSPPDTNEPTSFQLLLQDEDFIYDIVGNPVEIRDWRNPEDWPDGAKPVTKKIQYDDLYRATRVDYQYTTGDDEWKSPFEFENGDGDYNIAPEDEPRLAKPAPHQSFDKRILRQTFKYDWLGNTAVTDDDAHGFYDRSLGTIGNSTTKPYQLDTATQAVAGGTHNGNLTTEYDAAGNLTELAVTRNGNCLPTGASCDQVFEYEWDEVGRLVRAQRFDGGAGTAAADLRYYYDASDQRVIKQATVGTEDRYTVYLFDTLELRRAEFATDYEYTAETVVPYLLANGVRLARVMWEINAIPALDAGPVHVFFELGDHLGSTSVVLDQATGELVERSTFQAYGGAESDYRPSRWAGFREDYRFTGKEEDVEVGLQYFGKRFLNPLLGRWVSADPLGVHVPGVADWNLYAYVSASVLQAVDPLGLTPPYLRGPSGGFGFDLGAMAKGAWKQFKSDVADAAGSLTVLGYSMGGQVPPTPTEIERGVAATKKVIDATPKNTSEKAGAGAYNVVSTTVAVASVGAAIVKGAPKLRNLAPASWLRKELASRGDIVVGGAKPNRAIAEQLAEEAVSESDEMVDVYRGVNSVHPGYDDALRGTARPRGGSATAEQHNAGDTRSKWTSWTTDRAVAEDHAGGGVVLEDRARRSTLTESPDTFDEAEVLREGVIEGATPTRPKTE